MIGVGCAVQIPTHLEGGSAYPYGPRAFTIHPLSRIGGSTDETFSTVWVCVEFVDIDQQTARATGTLFARISAPGHPELEQSFDLNNLAMNNDLWDRPTRMYQLRFKIDPPLASEPRPSVGVEVRWSPVNGGQVVERGVVRAPHTSAHTSP